MNTKIRQRKTKSVNMEEIRLRIEKADAIVIGAGAGLSAAAGLNYHDEAFFAQHYGPFLKEGYKTVSEGIGAHWYLNEKNAKSYWGFWAHHIQNIYYRPGQLELYKAINKLVKDKAYFVITTNADGQFFKGGFDLDRIFAMQGSYGKFQCQKKCHESLYDNREMIQRMLEGFHKDRLEIRQADIPRCPVCGELLAPNLRIDGHFVEAENMRNGDKYVDFLNGRLADSVVFLELGVGFNTPVIIRSPFEEMTAAVPSWDLIRLNKHHPNIPEKLAGKGIGLAVDIDEFIEKTA